MSDKPADIPQDVWKAAHAVFSASIGDGPEPIARAIMAERERCAEVAETHFPQVPSYAADIAAAIRKGDAA